MVAKSDSFAPLSESRLGGDGDRCLAVAVRPSLFVEGNFEFPQEIASVDDLASELGKSDILCFSRAHGLVFLLGGLP